MTDNAITSVVHLRLKEGAAAAAREALEQSLGDTRAFDGCLGATVLADIADEQHLILIEEWASLAHDKAYRKWRAGAGAMTSTAGLFDGPPTITRCNRVGG
jgi:quinol monooxygenase YgiN